MIPSLYPGYVAGTSTNQTQNFEEQRLINTPGVKSYDVSLDTQTATVVAAPELDYETVLKTIKKTGKKVNTGEADGESKSVEILEG